MQIEAHMDLVGLFLGVFEHGEHSNELMRFINRPLLGIRMVDIGAVRFSFHSSILIELSILSLKRMLSTNWYNISII